MRVENIIDWEKVELDYRAGVKTLREIAGDHNITHGAVNKRAKRDGWVRDLSTRIKAKTDYLVSIKEVSSPVSKNKRIPETQIVEANAVQQSTIILYERNDVTAARSLTQKLFAELAAQTDNAIDFESIGEILDGGDNDKLNALYKRVVSFPGRVKAIKDLTDALKTLIDLERRVYKIDDSQGEEDKSRKVSIDVQFV